jgi:hypothetical protein
MSDWDDTEYIQQTHFFYNVAILWIELLLAAADDDNDNDHYWHSELNYWMQLLLHCVVPLNLRILYSRMIQ